MYIVEYRLAPDLMMLLASFGHTLTNPTPHGVRP